MVAKSKKASGKAKKSAEKSKKPAGRAKSAKKSGGKAKPAKKGSPRRRSSDGPRSRSGGGDVTLNEIDYTDSSGDKSGPASIRVTIKYWSAVPDESQDVPKGTNKSYAFKNVQQVTTNGVSYPPVIPANPNMCVDRAVFGYDGRNWTVAVLACHSTLRS